MTNTVRIFVSDFGEARVGPLFEAAHAALDADLGKSKRTKAYKLAKAKRNDLDQCLMTLAWVWFNAGEMMDVTP